MARAGRGRLVGFEGGRRSDVERLAGSALGDDGTSNQTWEEEGLCGAGAAQAENNILMQGPRGNQGVCEASWRVTESSKVAKATGWAAVPVGWLFCTTCLEGGGSYSYM